MFIGTKVGQFSFSQRSHRDGYLIEETYEGDIIKEQAQSITDTFRKFSEKYGIKTETAKPKRADVVPALDAAGLSEAISNVINAQGFT